MKITIKAPKKSKLGFVDNARPTIYFNEDQVKGLKDLKMDQECCLELNVKVLNIGRMQYNGNKVQVEFEIMSGELDDESEDEPKNTMEAKNSISKKMKENDD